MTDGRLKGLDGLRGVAAIGAVLFHAHISLLPFGHGYLAVDFFFMLSGFVIARSYEAAIVRGHGRHTTKAVRYMMGRIGRLYPMLFLGGAVGLAVFSAGAGEYRPTGRPDLILAIVSQFLLIPFLSSDGFYAFNRAQWSIALELLVNAVHATVLPWLNMRALWAIVVISAVALGVAADNCGTLNTVCQPQGMFSVLVLARAFFGFFIGVVLCRTHDKWATAVPQVSFSLLAITMLCLLSMPLQSLAGQPGRALYDFFCVTVIFPLIVVLAVRSTAGKPALVLGVMSYPLYAIHLPLLDLLRHFVENEWLAIFALALLAVASWAIGHWIDEPLNVMRRNRKSRARFRVTNPSLVGAKSPRQAGPQPRAPDCEFGKSSSGGAPLDPRPKTSPPGAF